jgi:hypothetical protein
MKTETIVSIGGRLGARELLTLTGDTDEARMRHFTLMPREAQISAILRLHASGFSDHAISAATKLSVEQICRLLGNREQRA